MFDSTTTSGCFPVVELLPGPEDAPPSAPASTEVRRIAVIAARRHEGIGRRLRVGLIEASEAQGYGALSLSVNTDNPARFLYEWVDVGTPIEISRGQKEEIRRALPAS